MGERKQPLWTSPGDVLVEDRAVIVRGWLIIGDQYASATLPPERGRGMFTAGTPSAAGFDVGDWVLWAPPGSFLPVCLVCVEVPLA